MEWLNTNLLAIIVLNGGIKIKGDELKPYKPTGKDKNFLRDMRPLTDSRGTSVSVGDILQHHKDGGRMKIKKIGLYLLIRLLDIPEKFQVHKIRRCDLKECGWVKV